MLLQGIEVGSRHCCGPVDEGLLHVLFVILLTASSVLVDLLTYSLEGAVFWTEMIFLQLGFDVLDEQLIALLMQLLLECGLLFVVNDGDEEFIDEAKVVKAHEYVVGLVDGFDKRIEE